MHVLVTFLEVDPDGPLPSDPRALLRPPPRLLWHYTTAHKLEAILTSGKITPATAAIDPGESPVAWFSSRPTWEPTATKCPAPGRLGQILTAAAQGGLVRIAVRPEVAPYRFAHLPLVAGTPPSTCVRLCVAGIEMGADPDDWHFATTPVRQADWIAIERYRFEDDLWVTADLQGSDTADPIRHGSPPAPIPHGAPP